MDNSSNAVILARVSSKGQEIEGYSLDSQYKLLQGYSANLNLHVVKVFQIAESASKEQGRKVFHEMMHFASLKRNNVYHLVVEKADRYTRNFRDAVALDDWLAQDASRKLHSVKESIVLHAESKSDVKFMWNIHVASAKKYVDNLREEAMKGWAEKLAQGWLPSVPPPGYMTVTKNGKRIHIPNPDTKVLVKKAFHAYLEPSHSLATLTDYMSSIGIRTRKGRPMSKSHVQKMLLNPFYIGINRFNGKDYPGAQETFISKEVFEKVQYKMHRKRPSRYKHHNPVFKNVIQCANCGGVVTWQIQKGRFYGTCQRNDEVCRGRKMLREDRIEQAIVEMLNKLVCPSQEIIQWVADSMRDQHQTNIEEKERLWSSVKVQIERVSRMDEGLYDDKLAGDISAEKYQEKHGEFMKQKEELERQLTSIDRSLGNRLDQALVLLELSQKAAEIFPKKTPQQKRLIITKLFKKVTFDSDSLSVSFTNFAQVIANNVEETRKLIGGQK
jgi:DNA invertase Pin-like site-specific DNA recombinase